MCTVRKDLCLRLTCFKTENSLHSFCGDLQDGSGSSVRQGQTPIIESTPVASVSRDKPSILPVEDTRKLQTPGSPSSPTVSSRAYAAPKINVGSQEHQPPVAEIPCTSRGSSDVLEKARAAIAAASRASAAARAAADLVKVKVATQWCVPAVDARFWQTTTWWTYFIA